MSKHEHHWNPKTLTCISCGIGYQEAWEESAKTRAMCDKRNGELPPITQLERGVEA